MPNPTIQGTAGHAAGGVLQGPKPVNQTKLHDEDEAEDRYTGGTTAIRPTARYRRAGVWTHQQHRLKALQSARLGEGEYAMGSGSV